MPPLPLGSRVKTTSELIQDYFKNFLFKDYFKGTSTTSEVSKYDIKTSSRLYQD